MNGATDGATDATSLDGSIGLAVNPPVVTAAPPILTPIVPNVLPSRSISGSSRKRRSDVVAGEVNETNVSPLKKKVEIGPVPQQVPAEVAGNASKKGGTYLNYR